MLQFAGVVLVSLIMVDVIWSTLTTRGSGPVTGPLTTGLQILFTQTYRLSSRFGILSVAGPLAILCLGTVWVAGAWLGWMLIFSGMPGSVVNASTAIPADTLERFYFVGFTLSTLGVGDLKPSGHLAQVLTSIAAFNGLVLVTLIITYAIPVVSGAVARRKLAFTVSIRGEGPVDLIRRSWNGDNFQSLESTLTSVTEDLLQNAEQHLAYPIVGHFHSREPGGSMGLQIAVLDEALSLLAFGLERSQQPDPVIVANARDAVSHYLQRASRGLARTSSEVPPLPDPAALPGAGLRLRPAGEFAEAMVAQADRRRMLHQMVRNDGWDWSDVDKSTTTSAEAGR